MVTDLLVEHFPRVMDLKFTSHMEEELDQIETRKAQYSAGADGVLGAVLGGAAGSRDEDAEQRGAGDGREVSAVRQAAGASTTARRRAASSSAAPAIKEGCKYIKPVEGEAPRPQPVETEFKCPTCGKPMLQRMGKTGPFLGCSGYPECKTTMNFDATGKPVLSAKPTEHVCEKCGKPMVIREGRRGPFLACTGYPKCKNAKDVDANGNPVQADRLRAQVREMRLAR